MERFTSHSRQWWEHLYGDDPLVLSLPGVGPATGPCIRAYFGDGSGFDSAKKAANYVGITPSNWSSGTMNQPRRAISKEGPAPAASGVLPGRQRRPDHGPAAGRVLSPAHDRTRPLPHPGHHRCRQETGRKDLENPHHRADCTSSATLRGSPVTKRAAKELIASRYTVTPKQRSQSRSHTMEAKTGTPDTVRITTTATALAGRPPASVPPPARGVSGPTGPVPGPPAPSGRTPVTVHSVLPAVQSQKRLTSVRESLRGWW